MTKRHHVLGLAVIGAFLLLDCSPAQASAIALSNITAKNLHLTAASGSIVFDEFTTQAFAQAQNSLGELDPQFDAQFSAPSQADAFVTWAAGHAQSGAAEWFAASNVNLPGDDPKAASSVGQGSWINTFTITGGTGPVSVNFSVDLSGMLKLTTDSAGFAQTEVIFNLLLDGDTILFQDRLRSIGPNSVLIEPFVLTLATARNLQFDTPYSLFLRVDSESAALNEVPEPSTVMLVGLGVGVALWVRRTRVRGLVPPVALPSPLT